MANLKTTQLGYASTPLTGAEVMPVIQDGQTVQTTSAAIARIPFQQSQVYIGRYASAGGDYGIAIGNESYAMGGNGSIAIGAYAGATGTMGLALGYSASATGDLSVSVGPWSGSPGHRSIAVGYESLASGVYSTALGSNAESYGVNSIAIGKSSFTNVLANEAIAIGKYSSASASASRSVAIGLNASTNGKYAIAIGRNADASYKAVSIGYSVGALNSGIYSVSIGAYTNTGEGCVAIGSYSGASGINSIAVGSYARVVGTYSIAIGPASYAASYGSIALAASSQSFSHDAIAIGGTARYPYSVVIGPSEDVAAASFVVSGDTGGVLRPTDHYQKFVASTTSTGGAVIMTSDGDPPGAHNIPALPIGSIATIAGRVTGVTGALFDTDGDVFCCSLPPLLAYRKTDHSYTFIGDPTFLVENATESAAEWTVPTLTIVSNNLVLTVENDAVDIDWMAHLKIEASL